MQVTTPTRGSNGAIGNYWSDEGISLGNQIRLESQVF